MGSERKQLGLFGEAEGAGAPTPEKSSGRRLQPAAHSLELEALGRELPAGVLLGTSSWSFPGWAGLVYDRSRGKSTLSRGGLIPYAVHPLLRAVGVDRSYYNPVRAQELAAYAAQVPASFRFLVKAHEALVVGRYPNHPRYGVKRRQENPLFLDADYAREAVVEPFIEGLGERGFTLLFQFPPQDLRALGGGQAFIERLEAFFSALPRGPLYAVELRNKGLLRQGYLPALTRGGAVHCINVHPTMPPAREQASLWDRERPLVVRWMLRRDCTFEQARERYEPFDRIVDEDPEARQQIAELCHEAVTRGVPALVIINNKAEGSAPLSVEGLARAIIDLR